MRTSSMRYLYQAVVGLLLLGTAGCERLLEVQAPSQVQDDNLHKPANAKLLVDGSRAAFGCAFQAYINGAALLTDEMEDTQLAAAAWPWDRRDWTAQLAVGTPKRPAPPSRLSACTGRCRPHASRRRMRSSPSP